MLAVPGESSWAVRVYGNKITCANMHIKDENSENTMGPFGTVNAVRANVSTWLLPAYCLAELSN